MGHDLLSLEKQLAFYRSYHYNPINVLIHVLFVPTILFTYGGLLAYVTPFPDWPHLNPGTPVLVCYAIYWILLDTPMGLAALPLLYLIIDLNVKGARSVEGYWKYMLVINAVSWLAQFMGHGVYEKRAPALLDSLIQAVVLAPFFVMFELVFFLGYRTDLKMKMDAIARANIAEFEADEAKHS